MATAATIILGDSQLSLFDQTELSPESAKKASEILQDNHLSNYIFYNMVGLHNHIVHHTLTIYALGADPETLQRHYTNNKSWQLPQRPLQEDVVERLNDPEQFTKALGDSERYHEFLKLFQLEIERRGWEAVINEYFFSCDERAENLFERLHTLHPLIHLGCGLEFGQPAIIAEALALAAVHTSPLSGFPPEAEKAAAMIGKPTRKSLAQILEDIRTDDRISAVLSWTEGNKFQNGPVQKANKAMVEHASQWNMDTDDLDRFMAETVNNLAFVTGAAQRPPKIVKFDFFAIHGITTCHALMVVLEQPWITREIKIRLVEWMGRIIITVYASSGCPQLLPEEIKEYQPEAKYETEEHAWQELKKRALDVNDDGHTSKVVRGLLHGKMVSKKYERGDPRFPVQGDMWLKLCHMCLDSVEAAETRWIRFPGFPEAWNAFADRT